MQHHHVFEAVDQSLRDIRQYERPFDSIVVCFCGDFHQTLPIIVKGSRSQIVSACIKRSLLWRRIRTLRLTVNMHLLRPDLLPNQQEEQRVFAERILAVGDSRGIEPGSDTIQWPIRSIVPDNSVKTLADMVFPTISDHNAPLPTAAYLADRVILAARNDTVTEINHSILDSMRGEYHIFRSADSIINDSGRDIYTTEYLNTIEVANLPHHKLKVKIGISIILL